MASEKPAMILKSKIGMSDEEISKLSDSDAWKIIYSNSSSLMASKDKRLQVCFTGFSPSKKELLIRLAENHNIKVVMSVTKNLSILCVGDNAGPKKLEKAVEQGIQLLTESEFISMVETGEVPNQEG